MLTHMSPDGVGPERVVLLGKRGFVAASIARHLVKQGISVLPLGSDEIDLCTDDSGSRLAALLRPSDRLVFVSAKAPSRTLDDVAVNLTMARAVVGALALRPVEQLVYISSDAVYGEASGLVRESSPSQPGSLHGLMHATREQALRQSGQSALCILRPTLIYGADDPHNGYGPNRFLRQALAGEPIALFGGGEECRDHIRVEDVAMLVDLVLRHRSVGVINAVTGRSVSFAAAAALAAEAAEAPVPILPSQRRQPASHRYFDPTLRLKMFPAFHPASLKDGLQAMATELHRRGRNG